MDKGTSGIPITYRDEAYAMYKTWDLKWKDSVKNFLQYCNLKVDVIGQVGGRIWVGNQ